MISGLKTALILVLCLYPVSARAAWDLEALSDALAGQADGRVAFREERHVSYLTAPLELSGTLVRDGNRLEKHVTAPAPESFVIDEGRAEIETADGEHYTFTLADHPLLKGLATALRAGLAGEIASLQRTFDVALDGGAGDWRLRLFPRDEKLRDDLREIALSGSDGLVHEIRIEETGGDSAVMFLEHPAP